MKFQVIFTFDLEYAGYVAEVPELSGCVSQGKTLDEA
ncbi:MAG: type II toxin-antitoxin system HicB family antitoxin [Nostoc sp.]